MDVGEAHFAGASPGKMGWADQPTREFSKPTITENYTPTDTILAQSLPRELRSREKLRNANT
jgi:hypothetical protein